MKKLLIAVLAILITAVQTSAALAAPADRDHDKLPDRWERSHGLSTRVASAAGDPDHDRLDNRDEYRVGTDPKLRDSNGDRRRDGSEDSDGDGLSNAAEDRTGNDPANADTDGDGVRDGDEGAGTVASFDRGRLTIALAGGGTLSGRVTEDTDVGCGSENESELMQDLLDWDSSDDDRAQAAAASADDEESDGLDADDAERLDDEHDFADACPARWLRAGVNIREAALDGGDFDEVEFIHGR